MRTNGDADMVDGPLEAPIGVHPVDTGREEETTRGAFMVVGTMEEARELMKQLKMPDVEWMTPGKWVQRTWFADVPNSPFLTLAITAAAAGKWVLAHTTRDMRWRFEVPRARPAKEKQRQSPPTPYAMPSVAPQTAAGAPLPGAWGQRLRFMPQPVHPSPLSKSDLSALIKMEVASLLAQHEQQLAAVTAEAKRQEVELKVKEAELQVKEAEIDSLKKELAAVKDQAKTSAAPAAASLAPDLQCQPGKQELRWAVRDVRDLGKNVKEVEQKCASVQAGQTRRDHEVAVMSQSLSALQKQLDALQQLTVSEREVRQSQWASRSRRNGPPGAVVPTPQVFNFGGEASQQPLPQAPVWPVHQGIFAFGQAASAGVAPAEPEDEKGTVVVRPPKQESGERGEEDEEDEEVEEEPEDVLQVTVQLSSGGPTPAKVPPAVANVRACSKSPPPAKPMRVRSPGDTPVREEVLRQNATDRMPGVEDDAAKWAVVVAVPKEARELSAAAEFKQEEAARLVRRPLFGDQNFTI